VTSILPGQGGTSTRVRQIVRRREYLATLGMEAYGDQGEGLLILILTRFCP
jgi:hypothetical protein